MVLKVLDYVPNIYSRDSGELIFNLILDALKREEEVIISFYGCDSTTSSFVNSALIQLLEHFDFNIIKMMVKFENSTSQINGMIKKRFQFEIEKRSKYEEVLRRNSGSETQK
jgi:hypothetical protein